MAASAYRDFLATVKTELAAAKGAPQHRTELFEALDLFLDDFQAFLVFPGPKAEDRAEVANSTSTRLDYQDIQIALRLSDALNLNEVYSAGLVISTLEKGSFHDRGYSDVMRVSAGLWFIERDSLITSLKLLLHAVALDNEFNCNFISRIRRYITKFLDAGLRTRLISLIKELNEEGATGTGNYGLEPWIKDSTGALVDRRAAVQKTRLSLCHCLYLSCLISPLDAQELKNLYNLLKLCSGDGCLPHDAIKLKITYTIMFSLTNTLVSGAQGPEQTGFMLALDANSCQEFQELIMDVSDFTANVEGFTGIIRLAWAITQSISKQIPEVPGFGSTVEDDGILRLCLNRACDHDLFGFLNAGVFETAAFQNDERATAFKYTNRLCKLTLNLLSLPAGRQKIMELKYASMMTLSTRINHLEDTVPCDTGQAQNQAVQLQVQPLVSFLRFAKEIFQRGPELVINNNDLWNFVYFAGEGHTSYFTLVSFLDMLTALAECKEGAGKVYDLLHRSTISNLGWKNLFTSLVVYDQQLRLCMNTTKSFLPPFQEGDARVVVAYLKVLEKVIEKGDALERMQWFEDIEPLFKLLPCANVPTFLKGALRNAIAACASVSSIMREKVCSLLEQYDLPVLAAPIPSDGSGRYSIEQFFDLTYELNEVEARHQEYLSTISYLKLRNLLTVHEFDAKGGRYLETFQFVRDQVFGLYNQRLYVNPAEKWELVVAALHHFEILLNNYESTNEDARNKSARHSLSSMATTIPVSKYTIATPAIELMKDLKNGEVIYSNLMSILTLGVKFVLEERESQLYGRVLEEAVALSFQILTHAFLKESRFVEAWYPSHQPLHEIILQNSHQVGTLLEYVRYDKSQLIQRYSVKVMGLLSSRVPQLVSVLQEAEAVSNLTEGYATCLEARFLESHPPDIPDEDIGHLILRLLLVNLCEPAPNLTHLLLGFDIIQPVERTILQPNRRFSCLTVILHALDKLARPEVNAGLHELGFKLLYELCVDPLTCGPMVDLLRNGKYEFLPKRTSNTSHDTGPEKGNSSMSVTDLCLSDARDLELQTSDFDPAVGSGSETPSNSKPEVGFLNPEPLATRCTAKDNGGPGEGGLTALRSSWIQRLFPGMLGENVRFSQWKDKEKHSAPDYDNNERLLIENATKLAEDSAPSPQLLGVGEDSRPGDLRPVKQEEGSIMDILLPCTNSSQPPPGQEDPHAHDVGYSQSKGVDYAPSSIMELEAEKKLNDFLTPSHILSAEVDTRSMQLDHHPVQQHSLSTRNVIRVAQQQEQNQYDLNDLDTTNILVPQAESPSRRLRKSELQPGGTRNTFDTECLVAGIAGGECLKVDNMKTGELIGHRGQYGTDKGQTEGSLGSSPLPPLSLFAPFKHNKERRSIESQGKAKTAAGLSEDSLLTPLFPSHGYKNDLADNLGGADVSKDKFESSLFAPYKPLSAVDHSTGLSRLETPLMLTPVFAPFKTLEEQNRPSTSSVKTNILPLDRMEQSGEDAVGQDTGMDLDVMPEPTAEQTGHRGQLDSQLRARERTSSVYSSSSLPMINDQREAAVVLPNFGSRLNEGQYRVGRLNVRGFTLEGGFRTVNTAAIEPSSRRPGLQEDGVDDKDLSTTQVHDIQQSVSQGMRDSFQFGRELQHQRLNPESGTVRDLRPSSNLVCEVSSGSSPVPGGAVPHRQDGFKVEVSGREVRGGNTISAPVADAEMEEVIPDKETPEGTATFYAVGQSSEVLVSRQKPPVLAMEGQGLRQEKDSSGQADNAQEDKLGRFSRKRSHDARASESQFALRNPETISLAEPQKQLSAGNEPRTASRSQSWLQRWMPSSRPSATAFKAPQSCGSAPSGQLFLHAKNRRHVQDSNISGERLGEACSDAQEEHTTSEKAVPWAVSNSDNHYRNSNPLFSGFYPVPSAAAMALVGAASRRSVPLPPQRGGTRIAVWPAVAGMRRTESGTSGVLPAQAEVEVIVEEG